MILLVLALGCAGEPVALPPAAAVWVESRKVDEGAPARLHAPANTALPAVEGLTFTQVSIGDDGSAVWEIVGPKGSYVLDIPGPGDKLVPVYVDIGVDGPTGGAMADLASPPPPTPPIWPYLLAAALALATLLFAGMAAWKRWKPIPPAAPPERPEVIALREWNALRSRSDLVPADLALELSAVYRRYLDATCVWPATSRTTREILDNLATQLTATELDCARRLLSAMDLVKFADREAQVSLFEQLDLDFRRLVTPTVAARSPVGHV
jgi:hypothetical protein